MVFDKIEFNILRRFAIIFSINFRIIKKTDMQLMASLIIPDINIDCCVNKRSESHGSVCLFNVLIPFGGNYQTCQQFNNTLIFH